MKKGNIKLLTYGMATMNRERHNRASFWKASCLDYSEKQDSVFWEIDGRVFCSFIDQDGLPKLERVGRKAFPESGHFKVVQINVEDMRFRVLNQTYNKTNSELFQAREDAKSGKLTSLFLTDDEMFFQ